MGNENYEEILSRHGIRPTALRLLVYRNMAKFQDTFSMSDLEDMFETIDKSTLFRTVTLFAKHHLVHEIVDGSKSTKYCLIHKEHFSGLNDLHCHFYCEVCHKTFCLDHINIPAVRYPEGFELHQIDYLMKGVCPECAKKHS